MAMSYFYFKPLETSVSMLPSHLELLSSRLHVQKCEILETVDGTYNVKIEDKIHYRDLERSMVYKSHSSSFNSSRRPGLFQGKFVRESAACPHYFGFQASA